MGAAWRGVKTVVTSVWDGIWGAIKTVINAIASAWNSTVGKLSFHVPTWVPGIGGNGFDVPDIPYLARGGIVRRPTLAMVGESGPEAVVPLGAGVGPNVTVHVHGTVIAERELAETIRRELIRTSRRNGGALGLA